jgi:preprotein translocase subunit SecF
VRDGAQQQIVQDGQAAQSNAQEQERLLREMQSISSALGQARSQTLQQQNVVEVILSVVIIIIKVRLRSSGCIMLGAARDSSHGARPVRSGGHTERSE